MTAEMEAALRNNDPNAFVTGVLAAEGRTPQMANVATAIEQAMASEDPALQRFGQNMRQMLEYTAAAERLEMDAVAGAATSQQSHMEAIGAIWQNILGPDGQFQLSDLANLFKPEMLQQVIGVFMGQAFNGAASPDTAAMAEQNRLAEQAFRGAMASLRGAETPEGQEAAEAIRARIGVDGQDAVDAARQIQSIVTPPPSGPAPGG